MVMVIVVAAAASLEVFQVCNTIGKLGNRLGFGRWLREHEGG
jgi:hypothetical protein